MRTRSTVSVAVVLCTTLNAYCLQLSLPVFSLRLIGRSSKDVMLADENLYTLQSLDSSKPLKQLMEESHELLRDALVGSLRPKEYYCQQIGKDCRQRLSTYANFGSQKHQSETNIQLQAVAEYLHDARLTVLHRLVNITKQPFHPGTIEVSQIESGAYLQSHTEIISVMDQNHNK